MPAAAAGRSFYCGVFETVARFPYLVLDDGEPQLVGGVHHEYDRLGVAVVLRPQVAVAPRAAHIKDSKAAAGLAELVDAEADGGHDVCAARALGLEPLDDGAVAERRESGARGAVGDAGGGVSRRTSQKRAQPALQRAARNAALPRGAGHAFARGPVAACTRPDLAPWAHASVRSGAGEPHTLVVSSYCASRRGAPLAAVVQAHDDDVHLVRAAEGAAHRHAGK